MTEVKHLLFDLGGVLIENDTFAALGALRPDLDQATIRARWLDSSAVRAFELGRIAPAEFAARFIEEWQVRLTAAEFLRAFEAWPKGFYPGAEAWLKVLRQRYHVSCLSNANEIHWAKFGGYAGYFDCAYSSHLLGLIKPDREVFERVLELLNARADEVAFFDDSLPNVVTARSLGMQAHHVPAGFDPAWVPIA